MDNHEVVAVTSQPDRPAGRGLSVTPTPVSLLAREAGIPLFTPHKLDVEFAATVAALKPELLACASYGRIVSRPVLEIEGLKAALNVHPSILPHYRGASPIQSALRDGREATGVTIFWMVQALDAGDIAGSVPVPIMPSDDFGALHDKLAHAGAKLLLQCARELSAGILPRLPQNEHDATYTKPLSKDDLRLDYHRPAPAVVNQIRSLSPRPGGWLLYEGKRLKILEAKVAQGEPQGKADAGLVFSTEGRTFVKTHPGSIEVLRLILEGKPESSGAQFAQRVIEKR